MKTQSKKSGGGSGMGWGRWCGLINYPARENYSATLTAVDVSYNSFVKTDAGILIGSFCYLKILNTEPTRTQCCDVVNGLQCYPRVFWSKILSCFLVAASTRSLKITLWYVGYLTFSGYICGMVCLPNPYCWVWQELIKHAVLTE